MLAANITWCDMTTSLAHGGWLNYSYTNHYSYIYNVIMDKNVLFQEGYSYEVDINTCHNADVIKVCSMCK